MTVNTINWDAYDLIEVLSAEDKALFHRVMDSVYADDPRFIYPIENDVEGVFDSNKNKAFQTGAACRWILLNDKGVPVARIAAFYTHKPKSGKRGGIGFFECIDNRELAMKLWETAESWLVGAECIGIDAPINFGDRDSYWGLMISSANPTSYRENYNPNYYRDWIEGRGYALEIEQNTYDITSNNFNIERFGKIAQRVMAKENYRFEFLRYNQLMQFAQDFVLVYNQAWSFHDDFEPLTEKALFARFKEIKPAMPEEFAVIAYDNNRPIGLFVAILEINQVFKKFRGKMGLWQKFQFLTQRHTIDKAKAIVFGVVPSHHNLGIETALIMKFYQGILKTKKAESMELAWVGDFNPKMISMLESLGAVKTKIHHTYRKEIS